MIEAIGDVLPAAMGIALSPFPIVAIVLVLGTPRATANGVAFTAGWLAGLAALTAAILLLTGGADDPASDAPTVISWLRVAAGLGLLGLAVKKWRGRPAPGEGTPTPRWMASIGDIEPRRAVLLGAALGGANPKNVAFTLSASSSISALGLAGAEVASTATLYVVLATSIVLAAVLGHLVAGERAEPALARLEQFMTANGTAIVIVVLVLLGTKILGDGLAGI